MEVKYFNDYRHNYMIIKSQKETEETYSYKILSSGRIDGVLSYVIRHIDREVYLYYDISSKTTLDYQYQSKKMDFEEMKRLFYQLHKIYEGLNTYLLNEACIILDPQYIYYDLSKKQYMVMYYVDANGEGENPYEKFMEFLLDHVDTNHQQLADCVYQIYEMSDNVQFTFEDALNVLERCNRKNEKDSQNALLTGSAVQQVEQKQENSLFLPTYEEDLSINQNTVYQNKGNIGKEAESFLQDPEKNKNGKKYYAIFLFISIAGILGSLAVNYFYMLAEEELLFIYGCISVMAICGIICFVQLIKKEKEIPQKNETEDITSLYEQKTNGNRYLSIDQILDKEIKYEFDMSETPISEQKRLNNQDMKEQANADVFPNCSSDTVFFDAESLVENKLYALDRTNKKHIDLLKFPYTIGKMAGCVDFVVADESVSRLHARFDQQNGKTLLTDMNSKNGTYKNGIRMQPQETVEIEPGDEIRFGKLRYCFR